MAEAQKAFGTRVARLRRLRGWTQVEFAEQIDRSKTWVSEVERGARPIDRMSVLELLAEKLEVPLAELAADAPAIAARTPASDVVDRLQSVLLSARSLPRADSAPLAAELTELSHDVDGAWQLVHSGEYSGLPEALEPLISKLDRACAEVGRETQACVLLSSVYHALAAAFAKLGAFDSAWNATDRAFDAARSSGDPVLAAASVFRECVVFQGARRYAHVERIARDAAASLEDRFEQLGDPARSVWGALTLQRAVAAARTNDADNAYALVDAAREVATVVGEGRNDQHTEFGPLNVQMHEVAVAVDLGDAGRALRVAERIDSGSLSVERHCRLLIDIARAHAQRRDGERAVVALIAAEDLAPTIAREHYFARQITRDLVALTDNPSDELRSLATRMGILPADRQR
jgi:transcriptional regulator with XRE-family HTH domain